jgi:hypothetical protein
MRCAVWCVSCGVCGVCGVVCAACAVCACAVRCVQMPVMKLYVGYVKNYDQTEAALHKHEKRARFAALIKECKAMPANRRKLPLSAYLIMPIQRVARYATTAHTAAHALPHTLTNRTRTHEPKVSVAGAGDPATHAGRAPGPGPDGGGRRAAAGALRHHQRLQARRRFAQDVAPPHRPPHLRRARTHPAHTPGARAHLR